MSLSSLVTSQSKNAIVKYGTSISLVHKSSVYDETSGVTAIQETTSTVKAVVDTRVSRLNPDSVTSYDIKLLFTGDTVISIGDAVTVAGVRYTIKQLLPVMAMEEIALYQAFGKRE